MEFEIWNLEFDIWNLEFDIDIDIDIELGFATRLERSYLFLAFFKQGIKAGVEGGIVAQIKKRSTNEGEIGFLATIKK